MLGALGALIRKDERTLFNKHTDGLYVSAPKLLLQEEENFTEELGYLIQKSLLEKWPFDGDDKEWQKLKIIFQQARLRILYTSEESHEWVLYLDNNTNIDINIAINKISTSSNNVNGNNHEDESKTSRSENIMDDIGNYAFSDQIMQQHINDSNNINNNDDNDDNERKHSSSDLLSNATDLECLGGVYQKFNFEFGDGKFHDIVSMGSTKNIGWNVLNSSNFDPYVLCNVGNILNLQRKINNTYGCRLPAELWHIILGFAIDCFQPITQMMEVDIVLRDVRRWTQNLYLSENLRRRDEFGDKRIRKLGQLFIEIGGMIDTEYIKYRKQFSVRKRLVRFMKDKFSQITNETQQKFKSLKNKQNDDKNNNNNDKNNDDNNNKNKGKKKKKKKRKKSQKNGNNNNNNKDKKKKRKKRDKGDRKNIKERENKYSRDRPSRDRPAHIRCHTIDVGMMKLNDHTPTLSHNKSVDLDYQ